jgi:hypothetical protein
MKKVVAIALALMFTTSVADAIQVAPECQKMKDPVGCTCAIQNGGGIAVRKGGGERWYSKRDGYRGRTATNEAFVQCNIKARGH